MITDREPTPEEHTKIVRSMKSTMTTAQVLGAVMLSLGLAGLWREQTILGYGFAILGLAWLAIASRNKVRLRRMQFEANLSSRGVP